MPLNFEWDISKALDNLRKHRVSFGEAITAFGDPLSLTIEDPSHSTDEERYITIGLSDRGRTLVVVYAERGDNIRIISARLATRHERGEHMKNRDDAGRDPDMRDEYDFSKGVRGKYADRFKKDSVAVVLDPDVAEVFPDSQSVNDALRALAHIIRERSQKTSA